MQKTANYQLNQWEATDKLSRADFNADNAAIDAALASAYSESNLPWEIGTIDMSQLAPAEPVKIFDFAPMALVLSSTVSHTGFLINGSTVQIPLVDNTSILTLSLEGAVLTATEFTGLPSKPLCYLALK